MMKEYDEVSQNSCNNVPTPISFVGETPLPSVKSSETRKKNHLDIEEEDDTISLTKKRRDRINNTSNNSIDDDDDDEFSKRSEEDVEIENIINKTINRYKQKNMSKKCMLLTVLAVALGTICAITFSMTIQSTKEETKSNVNGFSHTSQTEGQRPENATDRSYDDKQKLRNITTSIHKSLNQTSTMKPRIGKPSVANSSRPISPKESASATPRKPTQTKNSIKVPTSNNSTTTRAPSHSKGSTRPSNTNSSTSNSRTTSSRIDKSRKPTTEKPVHDGSAASSTKSTHIGSHPVHKSATPHISSSSNNTLSRKVSPSSIPSSSTDSMEQKNHQRVDSSRKAVQPKLGKNLKSTKFAHATDSAEIAERRVQMNNQVNTPSVSRKPFSQAKVSSTGDSGVTKNSSAKQKSDQQKLFNEPSS